MRWTPTAFCALLRGLADGTIGVVARDLPAPSPLAAEALNARPYAFLDDAPLEERRSRAVQARRWGEAEAVDALGRLDADAIAAVRAEAWPLVRSADEMHEALMQLGVVTAAEAAGVGRLGRRACGAGACRPRDAVARRVGRVRRLGRGRAAGRAAAAPS